MSQIEKKLRTDRLRLCWIVNVSHSLKRNAVCDHILQSGRGTK